MGQWVISYAGLAFAYALVVSCILLGIVRLMGRNLRWDVVPFVLCTWWFVFLALHPFPSLGGLNCPVPTAIPQLQLFEFMNRIEPGVGLLDMIRDRTLASTVMNFMICFVIGICLAPHVSRLYFALIFGVCLTVVIEMSQLTGLWGIYPCAYRQFDVDDLMTNVSGVMSGAIVMRAVMRRRTLQLRG